MHRLASGDHGRNQILPVNPPLHRYSQKMEADDAHQDPSEQFMGFVQSLDPGKIEESRKGTLSFLGTQGCDPGKEEQKPQHQHEPDGPAPRWVVAKVAWWCSAHDLPQIAPDFPGRVGEGREPGFAGTREAPCQAKQQQSAEKIAGQ